MPQYAKEKGVQMLVSLMKQHGIKKVIVSPGMKNMPFIASVQFDSFFEVYSCVDERSAAYMACGLAEESGEPVALSCTGATASRNYISALTEAFYRNIPILAVTSMSHQGEISHLVPQVIDRSVPLKDIVKESVQINPVHTPKDEWDVNVKLNRALLALTHHNGGPVHINLVSENYTQFTDNIPVARKISRYSYEDQLPQIAATKVAVFIGAHRRFTKELTLLLDTFCESYNGVVLCDNTSNYYGKYRVCPSTLNAQVQGRFPIFDIELLIHIGDVSGSYLTFRAKNVWRVNPDGIVRDTFKKLEAVFEMSEKYFFSYYCENRKVGKEVSYWTEWENACALAEVQGEALPFSNAWIASRIEPNLPDKAVLFLGILNSLRNWNFFQLKQGIPCYANTGGFGIDGIISTAIGAALANSEKIYYVVLGDLAFFYDMNALGNRHVPTNLRMILINNGRGIEFRNYRHPSAEFGDDADAYMAAAGHFGNQSKDLVKHYAGDLGYQYYSAANKEEFLEIEPILLSAKAADRAMVIEIFTTTEDESRALEMMRNIYQEKSAKQLAKNILGESGVKTVKRILKRG